jgi:AcrR family transcriptional regulator
MDAENVAPIVDEPLAHSLRAAPQTTRDVLVQLAAEVFATEGYASASVRDLSRRAGVTSGAIYGNFRGKADLLVEAVDARILTDLWTLPPEVVSGSMLEMVSYQFENYQTREDLMSLLIEGAMAARSDPEVQTRLRDLVLSRLEASAGSIESRRVEEGYQDDVDSSTVAKTLWAIDIGLRVLTALGVPRPAPADLADVGRHFLLGLKEPDVATAAPAPRSKVKKVKTKSSGKK